uniref:Uncharacterized protein n=1 Tax=Heterorhabditis bacteriophora TaxID=37862 RepID=A0A1I7WJV2_HETBA
MHLDGKFGRLRGIAFMSRGICLRALKSRGICLSALPPSPLWEFLRASKALRKPLTTSSWTRPQLPSG